MSPSSLLRTAVVLGSLLLVSAANFPDALCVFPDWPSC